MRIALAALAAVVVLSVGVFLATSGGNDSTTTTTRTPAAAADEGPAALGEASTTTTSGVATTPATTRPPRTTSTTVDRPATTRPPATAPTPATTPGVEPNNPPVVTIGPPEPLQRFEAFFNPATSRFAASVPLVANVTDPEGDAFTVDWFSSMEGYLGTGQSITATLHPDLDVSQPVITARATDATGAVGEGRLQVIVWIRSDE